MPGHASTKHRTTARSRNVRALRIEGNCGYDSPVRRSPSPSIGLVTAVTFGLGCGGARTQTKDSTAEEVLDRAIAAEAKPRTMPTGDVDGAAVPLPLHEVARARNAPIGVHVVEGSDLLVRAGGALASFRGQNELALDGTAIRGVDGELRTLVGRWPEDVWMTAETRADGTSRCASYHWVRDHAVRVPPGADECYVDLSPWTGDAPIGLVASASQRRLDKAYLKVRFEVQGKRTAHEIDKGICWDRAAGTRQGALFVSGHGCGGSVLVVERWKKGEVRGTLDTMPGVEWKSVSSLVVGPVFARGDDDAYVSASFARAGEAAKPYLVHWDGERWTVVPVPQRMPHLVSLAVTDEGDVWLTLDEGARTVKTTAPVGELWRRLVDGTWKFVELPRTVPSGDRFTYRSAERRYYRADPVPPSPVPVAVAAHKGRVFVTALLPVGDDERWSLFSTRRAQRVLELPEPEPRELPVTDACTTVFVSLGEVPSTIALDYDFPAVRRMLAGHVEVEGVELIETIAHGKRVFGLFAPNLALARRVVPIVAPLLRGKDPPLVCAAPIATRVVRFRLASGQVVSEVETPTNEPTAPTEPSQ